MHFFENIIFSVTDIKIDRRIACLLTSEFYFWFFLTSAKAWRSTCVLHSLHTILWNTAFHSIQKYGQNLQIG